MVTEYDEDELQHEAVPGADPVHVAFGQLISAVIESTSAGPTRERAVTDLLRTYARLRDLLHRQAMH